MKHSNKINSVTSNINAEISAKISLVFFTDAEVVNELKKADIPEHIKTKIKNKKFWISLFRIINEKIDIEITKHKIPTINPLKIPVILEFITG